MKSLLSNINGVFQNEIDDANENQEASYHINWIKQMRDATLEIIEIFEIESLLECDRIEKLILDKGYSFLYGINYTNVIHTIVINPSNKTLTNNIFKAKSKLECLKLVELHLKEGLSE